VSVILALWLLALSPNIMNKLILIFTSFERYKGSEKSAIIFNDVS